MENILSTGVIERLLLGEDQVESEPPILQILGWRVVVGAGQHKRIYRLLVSDGLHTYGLTALAPTLNSLTMDGGGGLRPYSIIECSHIEVNKPHKDRPAVIIIMDLVVLYSAADLDFLPRRSRVLGNPTPWPGKHSQTWSKNMKKKAQKKQSDMPKPEDFISYLIPIADITPFSTKCAIKARVIKKRKVRVRRRDNEPLLILHLSDKSAEIRAIVPRQLTQTHYEEIQEDEIYYFKRFAVRSTNFILDSMFELELVAETDILHTHEESESVPSLSYNFEGISRIAELKVGALVDVLGVCRKIGALVRSKEDETMLRRNVYLIDQTKVEIMLTLWGAEAEGGHFLISDGADPHPLVAVKRARVMGFRGKSLALSTTSILQFNPRLDEAETLRSWFQEDGRKLQNMESISCGDYKPASGTPWMFLGDIRLKELRTDETEYFWSKVMITDYNRDSILYRSCPECKKKVKQVQISVWHCDACDIDHTTDTTLKYSLLIKVQAMDATGSLWATCFERAGEQLLGLNAQDLERPSASVLLAKMLRDVLYKYFLIKFKVMNEFFIGETRLVSSVLEVRGLNFADYTRRLLLGDSIN